MRINCVVACNHMGDGPGFFPVVVRCRQAQYNNGDHYEAAKGQAEFHRYDGPYVAYDERDGPSWLFSKFDWEVADVVDV